MSELKPCPFCGAMLEPAVARVLQHPENDCVLSLAIFYEDQWNRRAPSQVVAEVVKEMRAELFNEPGTPMWIRAQVIDWANKLERGE